jgi:hypothetical protein
MCKQTGFLDIVENIIYDDDAYHNIFSIWRIISLQPEKSGSGRRIETGFASFILLSFVSKSVP